MSDVLMFGQMLCFCMYVKQCTSWDARQISEEYSDNKIKSDTLKEKKTCHQRRQQLLPECFMQAVQQEAQAKPTLFV